MSVKTNRRPPFVVVQTRRPSRDGDSALRLVEAEYERPDPVMREAVAAFDRLFETRQSG